MALRLIEVSLPRGQAAGAAELLSELPGTSVFNGATEDDTLLRVLVRADQSEAVSDLLARKYGSTPDFRVVSLAVEATLPKIEEPAETEEAAQTRRREARRISREELYEDLVYAARATPVFVASVVLSTVVAAVGLVRGDVAVIIGAMVIAPLLGPNVALALSATLGDPSLARHSLRTIGIGVATAFALSLLLGVVLQVNPLAPEIASRTRAGVADIALALSAGAAGSLAFTTGVPAAVVGVMVAVALLPPLVVTGLLLGAGYVTLAGGALVLLLTNVSCVNLAAMATFVIQRVQPRTWWEAERARQATRRAVAAWVLMLGVLLVLILLGELRAV